MRTQICVKDTFCAVSPLYSSKAVMFYRNLYFCAYSEQQDHQKEFPRHYSTLLMHKELIQLPKRRCVEIIQQLSHICCQDLSLTRQINFVHSKLALGVDSAAFPGRWNYLEFEPGLHFSIGKYYSGLLCLFFLFAASLKDGGVNDNTYYSQASKNNQFMRIKVG